MTAAGRDQREKAFQNLARVVHTWAKASAKAKADSETGNMTGNKTNAAANQRHALDQWLDKRQRSLGRRRVQGASALAAIASAILVVVVLRGKGGPEQKLSFVVSGGAASSGGSVQPIRDPARLTFSDGSDVLLNPGARGRVVGTTARGARVQLEEGRARFAVAHRPRTDWSVEAGPFTVAVHGTVFDVAWSADRGALAVDLIAGSVEITGPMPGGVVTLQAGQRLTVRTTTGLAKVEQVDRQINRQSDWSSRIDRIEQIEQINVPDPSTAASSSAASTGVAVIAPGARENIPAGGKSADLERSPGRRSAIGAPRRLPAPATDRGRHFALVDRSTSADADANASTILALSAHWASRVAAGSFQSVIDDADAAGVERCLAVAPAHSLVALADAARYARRTDLARRALLAERRRFPNAAGAHDAAFLIGRLAEDATQDPREALLWYDRYLEEERRGTYTSEALGRKMLVLDRLGELADARGTAERYLVAYPAGPYTARARRIQAQR